MLGTRSTKKGTEVDDGREEAPSGAPTFMPPEPPLFEEEGVAELHAPDRPRGRAVPTALFSSMAVLILAAAVLAGLLLVPDIGGTRDQAKPALEDPSLRFSAETQDPADNPLYALGALPAAQCELPPLDPYSEASWEEFAEQAGACLDEMWLPHLDTIGVEPDSAQYLIRTDQEEDRDSEDGLTLGYYRDSVISIIHGHVTEFAANVPGGDHEGVWMGLLAHEYGHYVQDHTGILHDSWELEQAAESEEEELELLRRSELQADCLSGAALRAAGRYADDEIADVNESLNGGADSETHGSAGNRKRWFLLGWHSQTVDDCNTFTADPELVR